MKTRELVRKFVAAVDNIANGLSPRAQVDFFTPRGPFKVSRRDGAYVPDPSSFYRYDPVADAFISLDVRASARLYISLKPLFQEAYRELGYPDEDFHATLTRAVAELLATPVVEGRVLLEKKVASYALVDPELEGMSPAQKHLFRMGPENVQVIQTKLRALAIACGIPEYRLPKARIVLRRPRRRRRIESSPLFPVEGILPLEIRDAVLPDGEGLRLKEQVLEAQLEGRIGHPAILFGGHGPPELLGGLVAGTILAHEAQSDEGGKAGPDPAEDLDGVLRVAGKDEVPHDEALAGDAPRVELQDGLLDGHLADRGRGPFEIIRRARIPRGQAGRNVLQIGEINIDDPLQAGDDVGVVVAVGVVDDGDRESAPGPDFPERPEDGKDDMGRGDEVDVQRAARPGGRASWPRGRRRQRGFPR